MSLSSFRVKPEPELPLGTLADLQEWVIAECEYDNSILLQRFRVGDTAYSVGCKDRPPLKQDKARKYAVKRVIGTIVSD